MTLRRIEGFRHILGGFLHCLGGVDEWLNKMQRLFNALEVAQEIEEPDKKIDLPTEWPSKAQISFQDAELRYRPNTEKVLKGLTYDI